MATIYESMNKLFTGQDRAFGMYDLTNPETVEKNGTKTIGQASTVKAAVTVDLWKKHLDGEIGLGIIPIMDNSKVHFAAIDIDVYSNFDIEQLAYDVEALKLPFIICRTKSGGAHCYMFFREATPASIVVKKFSIFAGVLGYGSSEIYPRQTKVIATRGDMGQWINMPYQNGNDTNRYAVTSKGKKLRLEEFIALAEKMSITTAQFSALEVKLPDVFNDGPPCLQQLAALKFQTGSRSDGFLNVGIYLKKTQPENWENLMEEYNMLYASPPLSSGDLQSIIKSIRKKNYFYMCKKPPIKSYCNSALCKTRKYGIGGSENVTLTGLTKYTCQPPIWFVEVEGGGRLELSTEDLQSQQKFQRRCMDILNIMPVIVDPNAWRENISEVMANVTIIEAAADSSPRGLLFDNLEKFCCSRVQARTKEEIMLGKPWTDEKYHWFKLADFFAYLERMRFKEFKINQVSSLLREAGGEAVFMKFGNRSANVWKFPTFIENNDLESLAIKDINPM